MFNFCKECAIQALNSSNISVFPIPIYAIEQIIIDQDFDIVIIPTLRKSCIFDQTLFVANLPGNEFRISLAHELGHILLHDFFIHSTQKEARADAFALYFLMPSESFELNAKSFNIYELMELYGVPFEAVKNRFKLISEINN